MWNLMEGCSENQNLRAVSIYVCVFPDLHYTHSRSYTEVFFSALWTYCCFLGIWFCIFRCCPPSTRQLWVSQLAHYQIQTGGTMNHSHTAYSPPHSLMVWKCTFVFPKALSLLVMFRVLLKLPLCPQDSGALKLFTVCSRWTWHYCIVLVNIHWPKIVCWPMKESCGNILGAHAVIKSALS